MDIIRAIVDMTRSLDVEIIAEGIETAEQLEAVRGIGCRMAQGYYFSRPVGAGEAMRLLREQSTMAV